MRLIVKALASIAIGALLAPYLIWCWAQIAGYGLFSDPAIQAGLRGNTLYAVLTPVDFVATIVLVLPGAWALLKLGRERLALHLALALIALFAATAVLVGLPNISFGFWPAVSTILTYAALPVAVWLLANFRRRAPNNSFKPNPLRSTNNTAG